MKRIFYIILLSVSFASCSDMFMREIDYNGLDEPEMLVLRANLHVGGEARISTACSHFIGNGQASEDSLKHIDVDASIRINGGPWLTMEKDSSSMYILPGVILQPLDTVEIVASHPSFPKATAREILPGQMTARVVSCEVQSNNWVDVTLEFDAYHGNQDDMIGIAMIDGKLLSHTSYGDMEVNLEAIYSADAVFAEALNPEAAGYYGSYAYLFFPASALQQKRRIHLFVDRYWSEFERNICSGVELSSLELYTIAVTQSLYKLDRTMRNYNKDFEVSAPSGFPESEPTLSEEIIEILGDLLGEQEPIHVYTNIDGGLGHVGGFSSCYLTVK